MNIESIPRLQAFQVREIASGEFSVDRVLCGRKVRWGVYRKRAAAERACRAANASLECSAKEERRAP